MSNYIRKLVSGGKARFKDEELDLDLDLVYVTDHLIIMGFPAGGLEGFYRNRREDAKKFLDHRHHNDYWIFNFCPLSENSYDAAAFGGRVSRYPFPDHHAPPLAILALAAREMRLWLDGSSERVAVLHCKAGKGRSGTLACAYLLSLDISPNPPQLQRSYTAKQWAKLRAEEWMDVVETDDMDDMPKDEALLDSDTKDADSTPPSESSIAPVLAPDASISNLTRNAPHDPPTGPMLDKVLNLHTSRRMKPPSSSSSNSSKPEPKKPKQGVSIPSQRRFLLYWTSLLSRTAPSHLWPLTPLPSSARPKVKLRQITVRLREAGGAKMTLVKVVNAVLDKAAKGRSYTYGQDEKSPKGEDLWISLARYDDDFVELLEDWERRTRDEQGHLGKRHKEGGVQTEEDKGVMHIFDDGKWDKGKMVRSFARLGRVDEKVGVEENKEKERVFAHVLKPLNQTRWTLVQKSIAEHPNPATSDMPASMKNENDDVSFDDATPAGVQDDGIVLDAGREVRAKLYLGQIFMGWFWFIPTFHMPQPPPHVLEGTPEIVHWHLNRKDVDFPLGAGTWIVDIEVEMSWVPVESDAALKEPPLRQTSADSQEGRAGEPAQGGLLAAAAELTSGEGVSQAIETVQAGRD